MDGFIKLIIDNSNKFRIYAIRIGDDFYKILIERSYNYCNLKKKK